MFQFTNTIVLNSLKDSSGLDKIVVKGSDVEIRRVNLFKKANVKAIYKRAATDPVLSSAIIALPSGKLDAGLYRLKLYIRLSGSENSYYSTDFQFKGKPFYYEFKVETGKNNNNVVVANIKEIIEKIQNAYGERWIKAIIVGDSSDQLKIQATDEHQVFTEVKIEKLECNKPDACVKTYNPENYVEISGAGYSVNIIRGKEGFGTYIQLLKDLRLPTMEHFRFAAHNSEELPIPGMKYNQYTLYYKVDRGLFGGAAVGQQVTSVTTHVFYVLEPLDAAFKAAMDKLGTVKEIESPALINSGITDQGTTAHGGGSHSFTPGLKDVTPGTTEDSTLAYADANTDADWLKVTPGTSNVKVTAAPYVDGSAARTADVTVVAKAKSGGVSSKTVKVTQQHS